MNPKIRTLLSLVVFLFGASGLVFLYVYGPQLDTKEVLLAATTIGENQIIEANHIQISRMPSRAVPDHALVNPADVIGKVSKGVLPRGAYIYQEWVEDNDFYPKEGEILLPIPTSSIFAVNSSLRAKDYVHIAFFKRQSTTQHTEVIDLDQTPIPIDRADDQEVLQNMKVAAVRSSAGNMIFDTETGQSNNRLSATETIGSIELIISEQDAALIKQKLEQGYTLWVSRLK